MATIQDIVTIFAKHGYQYLIACSFGESCATHELSRNCELKNTLKVRSPNNYIKKQPDLSRNIVNRITYHLL